MAARELKIYFHSKNIYNAIYNYEFFYKLKFLSCETFHYEDL